MFPVCERRKGQFMNFQKLDKLFLSETGTHHHGQTKFDTEMACAMMN